MGRRAGLRTAGPGHPEPSETYINQTPYPFRTEGEERVLFLISPTQVVTFGEE